MGHLLFIIISAAVRPLSSSNYSDDVIVIYSQVIVSCSFFLIHKYLSTHKHKKRYTCTDTRAQAIYREVITLVNDANSELEPINTDDLTNSSSHIHTHTHTPQTDRSVSLCINEWQWSWRRGVGECGRLWRLGKLRICMCGCVCGFSSMLHLSIYLICTFPLGQLYADHRCFHISLYVYLDENMALLQHVSLSSNTFFHLQLFKK